MITIRKMVIEDYDAVYELWSNIPGMGLNDVDDLLESISKVGLSAFSENELGNQFWESVGFGSRDDCTYRDKKLVEMVYSANPYMNKNK